jgi:signal transduction histidine kinase
VRRRTVAVVSGVVARAREYVEADPRRLPSLLDVLLAVALAVLAQAQLPSGTALWVRFSLLGILALGVRRAQPLVSTLVLAGAVAIQGLSEEPPSNFALFLAVMLAAFTVAAECEIAGALLGGITLAAGVVAHDVNSVDYGSAAGMASDLVIPVILWGVGRAVRVQRRRADRAGELLRRLEADQDELARLAVVAERAHLARELHDVVTHSVSVVVVQAQGAQRVLGQGEPVVAKALADIESAGRGALVEMRRLLGLLRDEQQRNDGGTGPGVGDLPDLLELVAGSGPTVTLVQEGTQGRLDPLVSLTAYRIVQEALTNVLRHASRATVSVTLRWSDEWLEVCVADDGPAVGTGGASTGGDGSTGGRGLTGMRERVTAHGGSLEWGPRPGGGHRVAARLPVRWT